MFGFCACLASSETHGVYSWSMSLTVLSSWFQCVIFSEVQE